MPARFTAEEILDIKTSFAAGESQTAIARRYGCSKSSIQWHTNDNEKTRSAAKKTGPRKPAKVVILKCPGCPMLFIQPHGGRTYCSNDCRLRTMHRRQLERFAEFEWIALTDTWENVAQRVGFSSAKHLRAWLRTIKQDAWADRINEDVLMPRQGRWAA